MCGRFDALRSTCITAQNVFWVFVQPRRISTDFPAINNSVCSAESRFDKFAREHGKDGGCLFVVMCKNEFDAVNIEQ